MLQDFRMSINGEVVIRANNIHYCNEAARRHQEKKDIIRIEQLGYVDNPNNTYHYKWVLIEMVHYGNKIY